MFAANDNAVVVSMHRFPTEQFEPALTAVRGCRSWRGRSRGWEAAGARAEGCSTAAGEVAVCERGMEAAQPHRGCVLNSFRWTRLPHTRLQATSASSLGINWPNPRVCG